jgi:hypothetical protein
MPRQPALSGSPAWPRLAVLCGPRKGSLGGANRIMGGPSRGRWPAQMLARSRLDLVGACRGGRCRRARRSQSRSDAPSRRSFVVCFRRSSLGALRSCVHVDLIEPRTPPPVCTCTGTWLPAECRSQQILPNTGLNFTTYTTYVLGS